MKNLLKNLLLSVALLACLLATASCSSNVKAKDNTGAILVAYNGIGAPLNPGDTIYVAPSQQNRLYVSVDSESAQRVVVEEVFTSYFD